MVNERSRVSDYIAFRIVDHLASCQTRRSGGLELPDRYCTCGAIRSQMATRIVESHNIVTVSGNQYIAEGYCGETPTNFGTPNLSVTTAQNSPSSTSNWSDLTTIPSGGTKAIDGTYPQTDDGDTNNPGTPGANVATWRCSFGTSEAVGTLIGLAIHQSGASGTDPLLNHGLITSTKASGETLTCYVNHTIIGQA